MKRIKLISLFLAVIMTVAMLASCGKVKNAMEYEGEKVSVNMYSYWLSQYKSYYVNSSYDNDEYWSTEYADGKTYEDKMLEIVNSNVKINLVCLKLFNEFGLALSQTTLGEINTSLNDLVESYGSKSAVNQMLANYNINYDILKEIYTVEAKISTLYDHLYGEGGIREIKDEALDKFYQDNYTNVKIIMIYLTDTYEYDEEGELIFDPETNTYVTRELSDEEIEAQYEKADSIIARLDAGEDFEELREEYTEDPNKSHYVNGYFMSRINVSTYGTELVLAAQELEIGGYTMMEDEYAIYILKREELPEKAYLDEIDSEQFSGMAEYCSAEDFEEYLSPMVEKVAVHEENLAEYTVRNAPLIAY